jgi:uncharacterized repeat protein (TIGR02543 family)
MKRRLFAVLSVVLFGLLLVACGDKNYKVTFDVAGGTPAIASQTIKKDGLVTKPSDPTKDGYTFKLWEEKTSKKEWKFATDKVTKNITLVAQWEEVPPEVEKVTVTFEMKGGTPAVAAQTIDKGAKATKPADPTKDGFEFLGWYKGETAYDFTAAVNENLTLEAKWEELPPVVDKVTVTFDVKGGTPAVAAQTINKGAKATKPADPTKDGYEFLGWYKGETAYDFTAAVNENITLDAKWEAADGKLVYKFNGGYLSVADIIAEQDGEKIVATTYARTDWSGGSITVGHARVGAYWLTMAFKETDAVGVYELVGKGTGFEDDEATLYISYHDDITSDYADDIAAIYADIEEGDFVVIENLPEEAGTGLEINLYFMDPFEIKAELEFELADVDALLAPARSGHHFVGWYDNENLSGEPLTLEDLPELSVDDVVLYAKWKEIEYVFVEFDTLEGTPKPADQKIEKGEKAEKPNDPTKVGHDFLGWFVADVEFDFDEPVTADVVIVAKWDEHNKFKVTFKEDEDDDDPLEVYVYESLNVDKPDDPTKDGHEFLGWFAPNAPRVFDFSTPITNNLVLTAKWREFTATVTVTFDLDYDDAPEIPDAIVEVGAKVTEPAEPERDGFVFLGWYEEDAVEAFDFNLDLTEDVDLIANWLEIKSYEINYHLNDGTLGLEFDDRDDMVEAFLSDFYDFLVAKEVLDPDAIDLVTFIHGEGETTGYGGLYTSGTDSDIYTPHLLDGNNFAVDPDTGKFINQVEYNDWVPLILAMEVYTNTGNPVQHIWGVAWARVKPFFQQRNLWPGQHVGEKLQAIEDAYTNVPEEYLIPRSYLNSEEVILPIPKKEGFDFKGWHDNEDLLGDVITKIEKYSDGDRDLYANWAVLDLIEVTFDFDYGDDPIVVVEVRKGETVEAQEVPERFPYRFDGWYEEDATDPFDFGTAIVAELTLIAKWTELDTVTISFDLDYDDETLPDVVILKGEQIEAPEVPIRDEYDFVEWLLDDETYDFADAVDKDITLVAAWVLSPNIVYNLNDGTLDADAIIELLDTTYFAAPSPTSVNGTETNIGSRGLAWWYTLALKETEQEGIYELVGKGSGGSAGYSHPDATLYINYHDSYAGDYLTVIKGLFNNAPVGSLFIIESLDAPIEVYYVASVPSVITIRFKKVESLLEPIRGAHAFGGWFEEADFSGEEVTELPASIDETLELYAKWNPVAPDAPEIAYDENLGVISWPQVPFADEYEVYLKIAATSFKVATIAENSFDPRAVSEGLEGSNYYYVKAIRGTLASDASNDVLYNIPYVKQQLTVSGIVTDVVVLTAENYFARRNATDVTKLGNYLYLVTELYEHLEAEKAANEAFSVIALLDEDYKVTFVRSIFAKQTYTAADGWFEDDDYANNDAQLVKIDEYIKQGDYLLIGKNALKAAITFAGEEETVDARELLAYILVNPWDDFPAVAVAPKGWRAPMTEFIEAKDVVLSFGEPVYDYVAYIDDVGYLTIAEALADAAEGDTILLAAGEHVNEFRVEIDNLTFKPYDANEQVILKSLITFKNNLKGVKFEGLEFTANAQLHAPDGIDDFVFINNKVYDLDLVPTAYAPTSRIDVNSFIRFYKLAGSNIVGNVTIEHNKFENIDADIISMDRTKDKEINIRYNEFNNFVNSAIRFDGGYNNGTYNIVGNTFKHDTAGENKNAILFRAFAPETGNKQVINIKDNEFINVGNESMDFNASNGHPGSGTILFGVFNDRLTEVYINGNLFENVARAIHFRNAGAKADLSGDFSNNIFKNVADYYLHQVRPETHPAPEANFYYNLYFDDQGDSITDFEIIGQKIVNNESYDKLMTEVSGEMTAYEVDGVVVEAGDEDDTYVFGGLIPSYEEDLAIGRIAGNRVGVKIFAPEGVNLKQVLVIIGNKQYVFDDVKDGPDHFQWWPLVTEAGQEFEAVVVWNMLSTQTFTVKIKDDAEIAVAYIEDVGYASVADAIAAAAEGDTILLAPGEYNDPLSVAVNDLTFAPIKGSKVVFTNKIELAANLEGVKFEGLEFTGEAYIHAPGKIDDFVFINNKVYDTTLAKSEYKPRNLTDVNAFIRLFHAQLIHNMVGNVTIKDNEFTNISSDIISIARTAVDKEILIEGNLFHNFPNSAIRFDGQRNNATHNVFDNVFKQDVAGENINAIAFVFYAPSLGNKQVINIVGNEFINVGNDSMDFDPVTGHPGSGTIVFAVFNDQPVELNINDNVFRNVTRAIHFRNAGAKALIDADLTGNVFENVFDYYLYQTRPETYPAPEADFNYNLFIDEEGEIITDLAVIEAKIINNVSYENILKETSGRMTAYEVDGVEVEAGEEADTYIFGGVIPYYEEDLAIGRAKGHRVGVKIFALEGINLKDVLVTIGENEYIFDDVKDGVDHFQWWPLVTEAGQEFTAVVRWNSLFSQTFTIKIAEDAELETLVEPEIAYDEDLEVISWDAVPKANSYEVYLVIAAQPFKVATIDETSFDPITVSEGLEGSNYFYVKAVRDDYVKSNNSNQVLFNVPFVKEVMMVGDVTTEVAVVTAENYFARRNATDATKPGNYLYLVTGLYEHLEAEKAATEAFSVVALLDEDYQVTFVRNIFANQTYTAADGWFSDAAYAANNAQLVEIDQYINQGDYLLIGKNALTATITFAGEEETVDARELLAYILVNPWDGFPAAAVAPNGWRAPMTEFIDAKDVVLYFREEKGLKINYDLGEYGFYGKTREELVNEFLDDYTDFYNTANNANLERVTLLHPNDDGYDVSTALVGRLDNANANTAKIFQDDDFYNKWIWIIEYTKLNRILGKDDFDALINKTATDGSGIVKYELWAFLSERRHTSWPVSSDYRDYNNANAFWTFTPYNKVEQQADVVFDLLDNQLIESWNPKYVFKGFYDQNDNLVEKLPARITKDFLLTVKWERAYDYHETFEERPFTTSYTIVNFDGDSGTSWEAHARDEGAHSINGTGIIFQSASASYLEITFTNGVGGLYFEYRKAFTGANARQIEVLVNGVQKFVTPEFGSGAGAQEAIYVFEEEINKAGYVVVKIKNVGSGTGNQFTLANVKWEDYDDGKEKVLVDFDLDYAEGENFKIQINKGETLTAPTDPERIGYDFVHWYLDDEEVAFDFDATIDESITLKAKWEEEKISGPQTIIASYPAGTTTNMAANENNASLIGLNPNIFDVKTEKKSASNEVGLNQAGQIRLYAHRASGDGTKLTIEIDDDYVITDVKFVFGASTYTPRAELILGSGVPIELSAAEVTNDSYEANNLEITEFSLQNIQTTDDSGSNGQVFILSIEITFEPIED